MNQTELRTLLDALIASWESEVVEFKSVGDSYSTSDIGKYVSALANEANLHDLESAWLVFGVDNKSRTIVDSDYRRDRARLDGLKQQIVEGTSPAIGFREIHELFAPEGRVILFEIPAAPQGMPISWNGHYYARAGESLVPLPLDKQDAIRNQSSNTDWTAELVKEATLDHLDPTALDKSRQAFAQKHANRFERDEVLGWSNATFLDRAKVTRDGSVTKTALLLLGKTESSHLLSPHPAQIVWKLVGVDRGNEIFGPPFLLNSTALYQKIRNVQIRILPQDALLAVEVAKYDQKIVLEALHNCIAHQDYRRNARIVVTEQSDRLIFENDGDFFDGQPIDYVEGSKTPRRYRNPFLAQAMAELNMIDTMGYGIHLMYRGQARRFFPMPDYDLSQPNAVRMTLYGAIVDPAYSRLLIQKTDLPLGEVFALDRVQKGLPIDDEAIKRLRRRNLIEGRKPNLHVSSAIASATETKADYIRTRAQDDEHYRKLILDFVTKFQSATRADIEKLLLRNLSDALDDDQKRRKIGNLLSSMRKEGKIRNDGTRRFPVWVLDDATS